MELQLTIERPDGTVSQFRFTEEPVTIGSATANHVVIQDAELAPHQLIIFRERGDWVIRNLADGPEIHCADRPVGKGDTRPLGHEAHVRMGTYHVHWCSDAAPVGVQSELARPAAEASLPVEEEAPSGFAAAIPASPLGTDDMPSSHEAEPLTAMGTGVESSGADEVLDALGSSPLTSAAGSESMASEAEAFPPSREDTAPVMDVMSASAPALGDPRSMDVELPPALADVAAEATYMESEPVQEPDPLSDLRAEPEAEPLSDPLAGPMADPMTDPLAGPEVSLEDFGAPVPVSEARSTHPPSTDEVDLAGLEQAIESAQPQAASSPAVATDTFSEPEHVPDVVDEDAEPEVVAVSGPRITVHGLRRMFPFRTYPLLVSVTGSGPAAGPRRDLVRVIPSYPGCVVTPTSARLDLAQGAKGVRFWVTPVAVGRHKDTWLNIVRQGSKPARLKMPCRVVNRRLVVLLAFLTLATAALSFVAEAQAWPVADSLVNLLPASLGPTLAKGFDLAGGFLNCGLGLAGVFFVMTLVAYAFRRPRSVTITAGFSRR